jgi:hypothetical protein
MNNITQKTGKSFTIVKTCAAGSTYGRSRIYISAYPNP